MVNKSYSDIDREVWKREMVLLEQLHVQFRSTGQSNKCRSQGCAEKLHMLYNGNDRDPEGMYFHQKDRCPDELTTTARHFSRSALDP